tara:strand:- start:3929 stop:4888 length:960 start_codon:yes stop_codon:yes gene_type:complete
MIDIDKDEFSPINSTQLFGLKNYFINFAKLYKDKKLPKVILLNGDKGIGKFTLSFHLINYILSLNLENSYNFDKLAINPKSLIYKSILKNTQENFIYLGNDKNINKTDIDDVRNVKKKLNKSLLNNLPRFTVLDDVELLSSNSANALLKLIEEPSDFDYFFLIYNRKTSIIDTLRSRAIEIKIFLNNFQKESIFNDLLKFRNMETDFPKNYINYTTPGMLLNFSDCLKKIKLNKNDSFFNVASLLLEEFKKTKRSVYLDCIGFFLDLSFSKRVDKNNMKNIQDINTKIKTMNLLNQYRKFNLSNSSVLELLKGYSEHAR